LKRLLNTLYVTSPDAHLSRDGETVLVRIGGETRLQVPLHTLASIICFGPVACTPPLLGLCAERNVTVSFLSVYGRFLARIQGPVSGNVLLRREQYRRADSPASAVAVARGVVIGKIANCRTVLLRAARDTSAYHSEELGQAAARLSQHLTALLAPLPLDEVRGHEGDAARTYFSVFDHLIISQKEAFAFRGRSRRPPLDHVNALLSFLYTLLVHDVASALEGVGLDPAVGYLHRDRPGRPGLALDLMEEFRAYVADRLTLTLINLRQVNTEGFVTTESGAVVMDDETRRTVLLEYQKRKREEIRHPYLKEKVAVGLLPHIQAMLLARHLRGEMDSYPPFVYR